MAWSIALNGMARVVNAVASQGSLPFPDEIDRQMAAVEAAVADEERAQDAAERQRASSTGANPSASAGASVHAVPAAGRPPTGDRGMLAGPWSALPLWYLSVSACGYSKDCPAFLAAGTVGLMWAEWV